MFQGSSRDAFHIGEMTMSSKSSDLATVPKAMLRLKMQAPAMTKYKFMIFILVLLSK